MSFIYHIALFLHLLGFAGYLGGLLQTVLTHTEKTPQSSLRRQARIFNYFVQMILLSGLGLFIIKYSPTLSINNLLNIGAALHIVGFKTFLLIVLGALAGIYSVKIKKLPENQPLPKKLKWMCVLQIALILIALANGLMLRYY